MQYLSTGRWICQGAADAFLHRKQSYTARESSIYRGKVYYNQHLSHSGNRIYAISFYFIEYFS
jgi:hypothetical protein